jgi:hypothetical protein
MDHRIYHDPEQCRRIWEKIWPAKEIFDLWQVRSCFHESYMKPLQFHTLEHKGRIKGFLPLCWNEETQEFVLFPGETWKGKTWLEQNRIPAEDSETLKLLLGSVPGSLQLRYLSWNHVFEGIHQIKEDEIGYHFYPGMYNFLFENYWLGFSGKSRKKIRLEMNKLESRKLTFRFNTIKDLEHMFAMNQSAFANDSYFSDPKFYNAFDRLASFLSGMGMLRIVTILVGDKIAAVDMGGIFNNTYTLFAGGTNNEFPGIAKIINLHHMEWACQQRFDVVDFLCGDFNWKKRFHLSPRPLYEISVNKPMSQFNWSSYEKEALYA